MFSPLLGTRQHICSLDGRSGFGVWPLRKASFGMPFEWGSQI